MHREIIKKSLTTERPLGDTESAQRAYGWKIVFIEKCVFRYFNKSKNSIRSRRLAQADRGRSRLSSVEMTMNR